MSHLSDSSFITFLFLTIIIGGGASSAAGRALAITWRPIWQVFVYGVLLACVTRFFYFALFEGNLFSFQYLAVNCFFIIGMGLVSYRLTRVKQMITQYPWAYKRKGLFHWTTR